jgi:hypothetical protein
VASAEALGATVTAPGRGWVVTGGTAAPANTLACSTVVDPGGSGLRGHNLTAKQAVVATVVKGYDLDYAWRAVGEAYRGAGYYLAAAEAGEPPGTWWSRGAGWLGLAQGRRVERAFALRRDGRI